MDSSLDLEPMLQSLESGSTLNILAEVIIRCAGYNICRSAVHQQTFATDFDFLPSTSTFAILGGKIVTGGRHVLITTSVDSHVIQHQGLDMCNFNGSIEVCAGIGVVSTCLPFNKAYPVCFVEQNERFADWLKKKEIAPVVCGDIADPAVVKAVSEITSGRPVPISGGISCQPFSSLGDRREAADPRSQSLPAMLRMGYYLRSPLMTIECTKEAYDSMWVQDMLKTFAKQTGYVLNQRVLNLHNTWPAHRTRWWATLSMPSLGISNIPEMPQLDFVPAVVHLLQIHPHLPEEECAQLNLTAYELHHFHAQPQGIAGSIIDAAKAMPTATHSWGSQLGPCQCGCRQHGFSLSRLAKKGLYGVLIPLGTMVKNGEDWYHGMRHPHPKEVAILNALDPRYLNCDKGISLRFLLAGVGQMASPLQGSWVMANALFQMQQNGFPIDAPPPRHVLANMCRELFKARIEVWPHFSCNKSTVLFEREISRLDHPITMLHPDQVDDYATEQVAECHNQSKPWKFAHHPGDKQGDSSGSNTEDFQVGPQDRTGWDRDQCPGTQIILASKVPPEMNAEINTANADDDDTPCIVPHFKIQCESSPIAERQEQCLDSVGQHVPSNQSSPDLTFAQEDESGADSTPVEHARGSDLRSPADVQPELLGDNASGHFDSHVSRRTMEPYASEAGHVQFASGHARTAAKTKVHEITPACTAGLGGVMSSFHHGEQLIKLSGDVDPGQAKRVHAQIFKDRSEVVLNTAAVHPNALDPHPRAGVKAPGISATPGNHNADPCNQAIQSKTLKPVRACSFPSKDVPKDCAVPSDTIEVTQASRESDKVVDAQSSELAEANHDDPLPGLHAGGFAPGMSATPGHQNADQLCMPDKQGVTDSTKEMIPSPPHAGYPAPGMSATPGYQNADHDHSNQVPLTLNIRPTALRTAMATNTHQAGSLDPGMAATPGNHNADKQQLGNHHTSAESKYQPEMTQPEDPLMANDPWAAAIAKSTHHDLTCQTESQANATMMPAYDPNGGLTFFATKKRSQDHLDDVKAKRQCISNEGKSTHHQNVLSLATADQSYPSGTGRINGDDGETFYVWVGHEGTPLHQVAVTKGATVGQLAVAENQHLGLAEPVRTMTAMGSHLPVYKELFPSQIVLLESGNVEHKPTIPDMPGASRQNLLWHQQGWVANDEMSFYLRMLGQPNLTNTTAPLIMDNTDTDGPKFEQWLATGVDLKGTSNDVVVIHTACLYMNHWFPVTAKFDAETIHITTTLPDLPAVQKWAIDAWGPVFEFHYIVPLEGFPADCGFQALAWIMARTLEETRAYPMEVEEAIKWRYMFDQHLCNTGKANSRDFQVCFGGMMEPTAAELSALLQAHGVASERSPALANHLVQTFGALSIKQTLGSARPWADLKSKASAHKPPIKLVLTEELQQQIANRLQNVKPIGSKKNKQTKKASQAKWVPPPASQILIPDGIFQQQDGTPLKQITMHQLQSNHRGVAVVNIQDALPFFRTLKPVCTEGAAMLVLDFQDPSIPDTHQVIRFPASCAGTQEPMILTAALVQLGQQTITRALPADPTTIDQVDTAVVRAVLYRDQSTLAWQAISMKPVKALFELEHFSCLEKGDVLDVWDRQTLNKQFQRVKPEEADMFSVVMRVQASCFSRLMESNGKEGLFFEPRTPNGRGPCPNHRVIWLPKQTFHDVMFAKQATQHETCIARSGDRFGLRTKVEQAAAVHQQHRPEVAYLDGANTKTYRIAPLPFGTTKQSLQKVFETWEWNARPSHTQGLTPDKGGLTWIAHATEQPAFFIFTMQHGDVLITEMQPTKPVAKPNEGVPVASARTLKHLSASASTTPSSAAEVAQQDPLQVNDPWAGAASHLASSRSTITPSQVASIETNVERRIRAAMKDQLAGLKSEDTAMEPAVDPRVFQLEQQVNELTDNLNQLAGSVTSFKQQQQTHNTQVVQQVQALRTQADQQESFMKNLLDQKLEEQMHRIESLLTNKRPKTNE